MTFRGMQRVTDDFAHFVQRNEIGKRKEAKANNLIRLFYRKLTFPRLAILL
jgi:hypothetical protein